jgi:hypothetical protein
MLRLMMAPPDPQDRPVRVLGVDDFAFRAATPTARC